MSDVVAYRRPHFSIQPDHLYPPYRSTIKRSPTKPVVRAVAPTILEWHIFMQSSDETVFFDF